jgi:hypothetical protein
MPRLPRKSEKPPRKLSKKNIAEMNAALVGGFLGSICKTAEAALQAKDPGEKTKNLEKVCMLAKKAMAHQPSSVTLKPKKKPLSVKV